MPPSRRTPCELRLYITEELRDWLKATAADRSEPITTFARSLIVNAKEKMIRDDVCRSTDPLIRETHFLVRSIAGKLAVDLPGSEDENSAEKEG